MAIKHKAIKPVHGWAVADDEGVFEPTFRISERAAKQAYMQHCLLGRWTWDAAAKDGNLCLVPMVMLTKAEFEGLMAAAAIRDGKGNE